MSATLENLLTPAFTVVALALTLVALRAWRHARSPKTLLLALGFGLFLTKGIILSVGLFYSGQWEDQLLLPGLLLDLGALSLFYLAILRPAGR